MDRTILDLITFVNTANDFLGKHPAESKFAYALRKVVKQCAKVHNEYQEELTELGVEHCAVDKDGVILREADGSLRFTKEGLKKRNVAQKALVEKPRTVTPYLAKDVPVDITGAQREAFAGFVLPEDADIEPEGEAA